MKFRNLGKANKLFKGYKYVYFFFFLRQGYMQNLGVIALIRDWGVDRKSDQKNIKCNSLPFLEIAYGYPRV